MQRTALFLEPVVRRSCGEGVRRAHTGPVVFVLRALAARKLRQQRKSLRRGAAGKPVNYVRPSENKFLKVQLRCDVLLVRLVRDRIGQES